jgi:hypothetical protein
MTHFMFWLNATHPIIYLCLFLAVCSLPLVGLIGACATAPCTEEEEKQALMDKEF